MRFIWPDWRFRRLPAVVGKTLNANCRYLDAILMQYHRGKDNSLDYRIARRDAHNCDAELASVISNMSAEPKTRREAQEAAFRLLCLNHTLLSYISALGAHREKLRGEEILTLLDDAVCYVDDALHSEQSQSIQVEQELDALKQRIQQFTSEPEGKEQLVLQQIGLLIALLPELTLLNRQICQSD